MNNVMAMTALAAGLLVSTAAIAAPANLSDALQPASGLTLVKGVAAAVAVAASAAAAAIWAAAALHRRPRGWRRCRRPRRRSYRQRRRRIGGDAGPHFNGGEHIGGVGGPRGGVRYGANNHFDNGHNHFDHDHGRHARFFPGDAFFYGGDYADYGYYGGDCGWLARQARATGSAYWWQRYNECVY